MDPASTEVPPESPDEIVARAGTYYRWTRYIISIGLLIGYGGFFVKDGFFTWPQDLKRAQYLESIGSHPEVKPHSETDIRFQQVLGVIMPSLGLALLIWTLYNSRGQYRLSGHVLYVPGHPPVPLESIVKMDKSLWDKKGIALIEYALPRGEDSADTTAQSGKLKLDDFVYDRGPTDAIVERIEQIIAPPEDEAAATEPEADSAAPAGDDETAM
jgi:hypothetical protein